MSEYLKKMASNSKLSYEAREISCHAQENYVNRLRTKEYNYLKVHSFRGAIEQIICKDWPHLKHSGLRSLKYSNDMRFDDYCRLAVKDFQITISPEDIESDETKLNLDGWKNLVAFYTIRLMFAPLIESVIQKDRLLYTLENGNIFSILYVMVTVNTILFTHSR